jgi:hypothetical protein
MKKQTTKKEKPLKLTKSKYRQNIEEVLTEVELLSKEAENFFNTLEKKYCDKGKEDGDK